MKKKPHKTPASNPADPMQVLLVLLKQGRSPLFCLEIVDRLV